MVWGLGWGTRKTSVYEKGEVLTSLLKGSQGSCFRKTGGGARGPVRRQVGDTSVTQHFVEHECCGPGWQWREGGGGCW